MIENIIGTILGNGKRDESEGNRGIGSLIVVGIILFVLLGGMKLLKQPEETVEPPC